GARPHPAPAARQGPRAAALEALAQEPHEHRRRAERRARLRRRAAAADPGEGAVKLPAERGDVRLERGRAAAAPRRATRGRAVRLTAEGLRPEAAEGPVDL